MRILIMGGTWFLGRAVAEEALRRGWEVSTFNRGRSGPDVPGVRAVHGDRTDPENLSALASYWPWDVVVDTSSSALPPHDVLAGARVLQAVAEQYVYVSTVNAYRGWPSDPLTEQSELLDGPPDADAEYERLPEGWDGPDWYDQVKIRMAQLLSKLGPTTASTRCASASSTASSTRTPTVPARPAPPDPARPPETTARCAGEITPCPPSGSRFPYPSTPRNAMSEQNTSGQDDQDQPKGEGCIGCGTFKGRCMDPNRHSLM
ncbi:NAD-dependent epimerase/dehydratase family protein [Streptomyces sp. NRRL F-5755]|uniref:NAD-dependent epimerase/dehydratase family protein n=1 Tax=Streptomyces sp. NRRL F-5755 TaxID=1519475 RepID=UPI0006ADDD6D|nr:NAD-dependent epimerase/dehydratase family protein [Streptomyces sp. NRRL F-5755]